MQPLAQWRRSLVVLLVLFIAACFTTASQIPNTDCLACHSDTSLTGTVDGHSISLYVDDSRFQKSTHGSLGCTDCHSDITSLPHQAGLKKPDCSSCHADEHAAYGQSVHGRAVARGNTHAAGCLDCHGDVHAMLSSSDPASQVNHANIPRTCGRCHQQNFVMSASGISAQVFFSYQQSVHGKAVAAGSQSAAVCTDCHGTHQILMAGESKSSTFKFNVPGTCGKCHAKESEEYAQSVHGRAIQRGNWLAPVCTDCHGIHTIHARKDHSSSVSAEELVQLTCARCHNGVRLTAEFGLPAGRVSSYQSSYHGMASRLGSTIVANCASCHGSHLILASSDPRSTINEANLTATCGKCHAGASARFTRFPIHAGTSITPGVGDRVVSWTRRFYVTVILFVVGAMLFHNFVIWRSKALARRRLENATVIRMTLNQRIQHWILLICFALLVITGFALIPPFSSLADWIGIAESMRRMVHRIAACGLIGGALYHLIYALSTRGGREMLWAFIPEKKDILDAWATLRYHLGRRASRPEFGRFTYAEKFEYWALLWGTVVMAVTGLMVWFELLVTKFWPGWAIDLALTIHLYEAVLATLAILIWHFYQVIFDPDVFPMNWSWWDGRMPLSYYQHEHGLDSQTILQAQEAKEDVTNGDSQHKQQGPEQEDRSSHEGSRET